MLKGIQNFLREQLGEAAIQVNSSDEHSLQLATAAILIEVGRSDHDVAAVENEHIIQLLRQKFSLSVEELDALVELATAEVEEAVSLHQFTALVNREASAKQKAHMVEMMWQVAFADGRIDKYEEYLIRKVAELLYVPHVDFVRARHRAESELAK